MLWLCVACGLLALVALLLLVKIALDRRALDGIRQALGEKLEQDTNTLLTVPGGDRALRRLADDLNAQLRLLRDARRRYQNGDQALRDAVTNISHDLRTPLTAICGYMELLAREELPPGAREALRVIENRVDALRQLTEELLQYSITGAPSVYADREAVTLNGEVEACVAAYYGALTEKGVVPEISLPARPVIARVNRRALGRILDNILSNAIRYSDGDLRIELTEAGELRFSNRAARLDDVTVGRLFDRYYTVENGRDGTGLGLSIARALTERLGGSISAAKSDGLFTVRLRFPAD